MIRIIAATATAALLTISAASAQTTMDKPGNADSVKKEQAGCPAGTTDKNCKSGDVGQSSSPGSAGSGSNGGGPDSSNSAGTSGGTQGGAGTAGGPN